MASPEADKRRRREESLARAATAHKHAGPPRRLQLARGGVPGVVSAATVAAVLAGGAGKNGSTGCGKNALRDFSEAYTDQASEHVPKGSQP
jgi:hypothetical protein